MEETKDIRWKQRFSNYCLSLNQLEKFLNHGELNEFEKQGLIKAFEYTFELSWTVLKDFLEYRGTTNIFGSRDAFQEAFRLGIISDGALWMDMIKNRNRAVHAYDENTANLVIQEVRSAHILLFRSLKLKLEQFK
ncbi:MAG: nucleotidyltransferase substrate binding protein [Pseudobdellovibrionaceae bacterium]